MRPQDWITHLDRLGSAEPAALPPDLTLLSGDRGEQRLWRACSGTVPDATVLEAIRVALGDRGGALLSTDTFLAIEVWTECELAALHALTRLARHRNVEIARFSAIRAEEAIRWHLEHTQPDNATNRPWAIHAFLLAEDGSGEPTAYAGTLLHNMTATDARDEPLSRWILADAARELRLRGFGGQ
jgi:hypothetical protein